MRRWWIFVGAVLSLCSCSSEPLADNSTWPANCDAILVWRVGPYFMNNDGHKAVLYRKDTGQVLGTVVYSGLWAGPWEVRASSPNSWTAEAISEKQGQELLERHLSEVDAIPACYQISEEHYTFKDEKVQVEQ